MAEFGPGNIVGSRPPQPVAGEHVSFVAVEDPPRICFATPVPKTNPVCSYTEYKPLCGQPGRKQDAVSPDRDLVTCTTCRALLAGEGGRVPPLGHAQPLGLAPARLGGGYRQLLDTLNAEQLEAKKFELEGELAALQVFLEAARAREKTLNPGADGG